jgi:short-subunit dehydrogenase
MNTSSNYALVTGACSGIGRSISITLARRGYHIVAVSNQPDKLEELKAHIERTCSISVMTLNTDLSAENSARLVFDYCEDHKLPVEVLVNNAGMLIYGETVQADFGRMESVLRLHVTTPALLCRLFGERMIRNGKGYILNVSSISAVMPYPTISIYGPTKTFLLHFTRSIRTEMNPMGINVTCLLPGATDTSFYDGNNFNIDRVRKGGMVTAPEKVAGAGIKALFRNRAECTPGLLNKLAVAFVPLFPHFLITLIYRRLRRSGKPGKDSPQPG